MPAQPQELREPAPFLAPGEEVIWRFGSFTVWESQRRLERCGQPVRLGTRSFDLLLHLIKRAGHFVNNRELLAAVWAGVVVEEASVRVHMSMLRKGLGEPLESDGCKDWISNVPLRGYRFNASVLRERIVDPARPRTEASGSFNKLPVRLTEVIGRDAEIEGVLASLVSHRLVTIVGPGGIGKTSVAICAAERYQQKPGARIAFVDLAPLISPDHVLSTMALSLGVAADLPDALEAIAERLAGQDVLLLMDNCEHVLASVAVPITRLLMALPDARVIATSREMLGVTGEWVHRLPALAVPDAEQITLQEALHWPSVELLVERAKAAGAGAFNEAHGSLLARMSRQLDGLPLAIELVAARLSAQSVDHLTTRLEDHLRVLSIGNRTASARHKTLAAALDWSIDLLDEEELRLFRRLSVFRGRFDVQSAIGIADADMEPDVVFEALISLVNKSLVFFDSNDPVAPYRLLDMTRAYAATLLEKGGERAASLRRHGLLMLDLMKTATAELPELTGQAWGDRYVHLLDDVRFALEVSLAEREDAKTAASLVTASAPLWFHVSQVAEYRDRVAAALKLVEQQSEPLVETAAWLSVELIIALLHTGGSDPDLDAICDRALAGALATDVRILELQARWGRCTHDMFRGEYSAAFRHSETLLAVAMSWADPAALNLAHRVSAMANHFCGNFHASRQHSDASLRMSDRDMRNRTNMVGVDPIIAAKALLCRTIWIQGDTVEALAVAKDAVDRAEVAGHSVSLCAALFGACPVALWSGELELASRWVHRMMDEAQRRGLVGWLRYAEWFHQGLQVGAISDPGAHVREVVDRFGAYDAPRKEMLVTFCVDWVDDAMVARVSSGEGLWSAPEVMRAVGWRSEQQGECGDAEHFYLRALDLSRQQGATAWELRAALSLATLWARSGRSPQAAHLLEDTCGRVPPGSGSAALVQARELREALTRRSTSAGRTGQGMTKTPAADA